MALQQQQQQQQQRQQQCRRVSTCHLHPSVDPVTGFCPSCLRDRLSSIISPSHSLSSDPDLRRCKSYSLRKQGSLSLESDLRRRSCDVRPRSSLSSLFKADDGEGPDRGIVIESEELGFSGGEKFVANEVEQQGEDEEIQDGKTMKEHIELEFELKNRRSGSLWGGAASVFSQKLQKWRIKQQSKKREKKMEQPSGPRGVEPKGLMIGRRSCDTEPRFSLDVGKMSMDDPPRFSLDEPRASWDGYMVARTIPRLAPMLSVIENAMMVEDETNSVSESSSSQRRNSFDCSSSGKSSGKHRLPVEIEDAKSSPVAKIVVTGASTANSESILDNNPPKGSESASNNSASLKKKVLKILGFKSKSTETRNGEVEGDCFEKQIGDGNGIVKGKLVAKNSHVGSYKMIDLCHRSPNAADIRGPATTFERNRSMRYSPSPINFGNGLSRFHLAPPLSRRKKPERRSVLNSRSNARGVSRLN